MHAQVSGENALASFASLIEMQEKLLAAEATKREHQALAQSPCNLHAISTQISVRSACDPHPISVQSPCNLQALTAGIAAAADATGQGGGLARRLVLPKRSAGEPSRARPLLYLLARV